MESNKKALAIISFVTVMITLLVAIISDVVIFSEALGIFLGGTIISVIAFIILFVAMIVSFILIFGVYLVKEHGFWPLTLSFNLFKDILKDIQITPAQIATFRGWRIAFLVICVITMIIAIVALHKDEMISKKVPLKGMSVCALILSILGILTAISLLVITSQIV